MTDHTAIFDLLLGPVSPARGNLPVGDVLHGGDVMVPFGDMIEGLLVTNTPTTEAVAEKAVSQAAIDGNLFHQVAAVTDDVAVLLQTTSGSDNQPQAARVAENVVVFNENFRSLMPPETLIANGSLRQIINSEPVDIEPGKYQVVKSDVANGILHLELATDDHDVSRIRISIPTNLLKRDDNSNLNPLPGSNRVQLDSSGFESVRFEQLLSRLNVKEIEISSSSRAGRSPVFNEPVQVAIVGHEGARQVVIRGRMAKGNLQAVIDGRSETEIDTGVKGRPVISRERQAAERPLAPARTDEHRTIKVAMPIRGPLTGRQHVIARQPGPDLLGPSVFSIGNQELASGKTKSANIKPNLPMGFDDMISSAEKTDAGAGFGRVANTHKTSNEGTAARQMRFTLPDNIQSALRPNGQAIMIRIEPQHLGPARLSLTMHQSKLRARLVVDSVAARAVIENSLGRLIQQLARADIKLDHIEVTVSGGNSHNEAFKRHAHWGPRARTVDPKPNEQETAAATATAPPSLTYPHTLGGAGRIDLLA